MNSAISNVLLTNELPLLGENVSCEKSLQATFSLFHLNEWKILSNESLDDWTVRTRASVDPLKSFKRPEKVLKELKCH